MQITVSLSDQVPVIRVRATDSGEDVTPAVILDAAASFKDTGVRIELSGHLKLTENMEFTGFKNLQIVGVGKAIIEQRHSFNDFSPLTLRNCQSVSISDLALLGTGTPREDPDDQRKNPPQQNALRIIRSRYIWVERCKFGPLLGHGTIKMGVNISDDSHWVWVRANHFHRITACATIVGSGIWPHPEDRSKFEGHKCANIHIDDNDFDEVGAAVAIDDATAVSWVTRNRVRLHYVAALAVQDGSIWFAVTENICGPGRGPAVSIGHGDTFVYASRGIVAKNMAAGCNDGSLIAPNGFYSEDPAASSFNRGEGEHVEMCCNLDVPGG